MKQLLVIIALLICTTAYAEPRIWTDLSGKEIEAEFVKVIGEKLVLKTPEGNQIKIRVKELSIEDRSYIELVEPPKLSITFTKKAEQRFIESGPYIENNPARVFDYTFGAKVRQTSARPYNRKLQVEYFALGKESKTYGDKYVLLERRKSQFAPSKENKRSHKFNGRPVEVMEYVYASDTRGIQYGGFLVAITDERGEIIAVDASKQWLVDHVDNLKQLPTGAYFNKTCTRTFPTRPKRTHY